MTIPIVHCFDHNYVLPAAVAFQTLLENAKTPNASYELYVIGSGITDADKALLSKVVAKFPNGRLTFREPPKNPVPEGGISKKGHYSADLYYKLMLPDLFLELDKAIVADVDVVYEDDIAKALELFEADGKALVGGVWDLGYAAYHKAGLFPTGKPLIKRYLRKYSPSEVDALRIGAGLLVYDMRRLREDGMAREWMNFAVKNSYRAILPEQEAINLVCGDKLMMLPLNFMAIAEHAAAFDEMTEDERRRNSAWNEMYARPVQMHYASATKPWKDPGSSRADLWFAACARAGLIEEWRAWYAKYSRPIVELMEAKRLLSISCSIGKRIFNLQLTKR